MNEHLARLKAKIQEKPIPQELSKLPKPPFDSFGSDRGRHVSGIDKRPEPDPAKLEERKAMAMGGVPDRFLDAWARLQCQRPEGVTEQAWRQAIDDAGRFLDQWGSLAVQFGWTPGDLLDCPRDTAMGLAVTALGPEHAVAEGARVFDRLTRGEWVNPYAEESGDDRLCPDIGPALSSARAARLEGRQAFCDGYDPR